MRGILLTIALLFTISGFSQKLKTEYFENISARAIGPAGMSGRVTSIDVVLDQPEIIYVGTASGGVWKSINGGISWDPIFDEEDVASIGAIAINQQNPSEIWVGTGEGNPRNSHNSGSGLYKSIDAGKSWSYSGLKKTKLIHRIIIHKDDPNTVFVGTLGSAWGPNAQRGVYKTTDGGLNWFNKLYINDETGCGDLVTDPTNPNKLIAAMWEFGRKPHTFNSGGKGSGLYISYDAGENWKKLDQKEAGLPEGDLGRIGLAIAPSKPNIVYAYVEAKKNALYASTDGGHEWAKRGDKGMGNRPFYYADIFVDPENENRIYSLHSTVTWSEDGGKNWSTLIPYSGVHPDHHALWIHPTRPNFMINGNDGGLNFSYDKGQTWRFIENLPVGQFYHINYDMDYPYNVYGGMQDNGSWVGPSQVWKSGGIRNADWQEVMFGDGFDVVPDPEDNRFGYAMSQGGNVGRYDRLTGKNRFIKPVHPDGVPLRFNWNAPIAQDPFNTKGLFFGSQFVHYSSDQGKNWTIISGDLTTNNKDKQQQAKSGGLTIDATQAENYTTLTSICPSPVNQDIIWAGTDDGNLYVTQDRGENWYKLNDRLPEAPRGGWIPQIVASEKEEGEALVIINNYRKNDWRTYLYQTKDYGNRWSKLIPQLGDRGYARTIVQDPEEPKHMWLGTDLGLFFTIDGGENWNKWTNKFPSVNTSDLKIHPRELDLVIGTFGRAVHILDDLRPFRELAQNRAKTLKDSFAVFPAPDAYLASYRSVDGSRFGADGQFKGQNKRRGAMITGWTTPYKKGKAPKKMDKIKVKVVNATGDTIRTYSTTAKEGIFRFGWNLREDGVRYPRREKAKKDSDIPSGLRVVPGDYHLIFKYKSFIDSTWIKVHADPRIPYDKNGQMAIRKEQLKFQNTISRLSKSFEQLNQAKKNISQINKFLGHLPDTTQKEIKKLGKDQMAIIDSLSNEYMLPKDFKGIDSVTPKLSGKLWRTNYYLGSEIGAPGSNSMNMMKQSTTACEAAVQALNDYLEMDWEGYFKQVEAAGPKPWEELEKVE